MKALITFFLFILLFLFNGCNSSCDTLVKTVCNKEGHDSRKCKEITTILNSDYSVDLGCSKTLSNFQVCKKNEIIFNAIIHDKEHFCSKAMMLYNLKK